MKVGPLGVPFTITSPTESDTVKKKWTQLNNPFFPPLAARSKKTAHRSSEMYASRGPTTSDDVACSERARSTAHSRLDLHLGQGARLLLSRRVGHVGWASSWAAPVLVRVGVRVK